MLFGYMDNTRSVFAVISSAALGLAVLLVCGPSLGQEQTAMRESLEIIGDRPDFTESSATIPKLHLQGELGVVYSTIGTDEVLTAPNLLLRFGLVEHLEIRLGVPSVETSFAGSDPDTDVGGLELGFKTAFDVGESWALGLLPFAVFPMKGDHWSNAGMELGVKGLWAVDLTEMVSLGGNLGVVFEGVAAENVDMEPWYLASVALGVAPLDWLGVFVEVYGRMNNDADFIPVADGGFTFLVAPRLQLDIHGGVGLSEDAKGFEVGGGAIFLI